MIADGSASSRIGIQRALVSLGAKAHQVHLAPTFNSAKAELIEKRPDFVISDYRLGEYGGLDLLGVLKDQYPQDSDRTFILITGHSSETAIAEAAEEEVDAYILKPFTMEKLQKYFREAVYSKIKPDSYRSKINQGKEYLQKKSMEDAIKAFQEARKLSEKPSLACYYEGQGYFGLKVYPQADRSYRDGLEFNNIHYKCLTGLFDVLVLEGKTEEAYVILDRLTQYFPVSPQRLGVVLRLAVETENFAEIDHYYRIFLDLEHRSEALVRTVSAALIVCGMDHLNKHRFKQAEDVFQRAVTASNRSPKLIREIVQTWIRHQHRDEANRFIRMVPPEAQNSPEFRIMECLISGLEQDPQSPTFNEAIEKGRKLIAEGIHDREVYRMLIQKYEASGWQDSADHLRKDLTKRFE